MMPCYAMPRYAMLGGAVPSRQARRGARPCIGVRVLRGGQLLLSPRIPSRLPPSLSPPPPHQHRRGAICFSPNVAGGQLLLAAEGARHSPQVLPPRLAAAGDAPPSTHPPAPPRTCRSASSVRTPPSPPSIASLRRPPPSPPAIASRHRLPPSPPSIASRRLRDISTHPPTSRLLSCRPSPPHAHRATAARLRVRVHAGRARALGPSPDPNRYTAPMSTRCIDATRGVSV